MTTPSPAASPEADALVLCPADPAARTVGPRRAVDAARLAAAAPHLAVVGLEAENDLRALGAPACAAGPPAAPTACFDLLPQAVVARHAAGLKVAEVMTRARRRGSSPLAAEQLAAEEAHAEACCPRPLEPSAASPGGRPPRGHGAPTRTRVRGSGARAGW